MEQVQPKKVKFVFEGQDCTIKLVYRGQTTIALIVIGKQDMTYRDRCDRVYAGVATCHPKDIYSATDGIKMACRSALGINECNERRCQREHDIYREIRKTLNPKIQKAEFKIAVETIFEE